MSEKVALKGCASLTPLQQLGQVLRKRREELGLDLETLQARTKIRTRYLEALENGDWSVLPGQVYARGFVRNYAENVGLDGLALLKTYVDETAVQPAADTSAADREAANPPRGTPAPVQEAPPEPSAKGSSAVVDPPIHTGYRPETRDAERSKQSGRASAASRGERSGGKSRAARDARTGGSSPGNGRQRGGSRQFGGIGGQAAAVAAILVVLGGGLWFVHNSAHSAASHNAAGNPAGTGVANASDGGNASGIHPQSNSTSKSSGVTGNTTGNATGNAAGNATGAGGAPTVQITTEPFQTSPPTQTFVVQAKGALSVTLSVASNPCWVSVTADNTVVDGSDMLQPGQSKTWTGNTSVNINLGNPPAATLTINGQPVTLPPSQSPYHVVVEKASAKG
ncbi:DUF4115 domain-containing protein [Alicyclobacillus cycloheptanicus]|nr:DUF4115 domain-containing protein [Alicyclobacillus cycloheptanicus]